jgi:hypothetical protein
VRQLAQWRAAFQSLEGECPWPGPRPLSLERDLGKGWRFVGRLQEIRQFLEALEANDLVILHGTSGAGKTSLLNVGLLTVMQREGSVPLVCNRWAAMPGDDAERFITDLLRDSARLPEEVSSHMAEHGLRLTRALDELYGQDAVLVLDQFEELIRYQRDRFLQVISWLLSVNRERHTKVVLSLRSEYLYELAPLLREMRPFSMTQLELGPISDIADIEALVVGPNDSGRLVIEPDAAAAVVDAWKSLPAESRERSLLYLHALLYAMFFRARSAGRTVVTMSDLELLHGRPVGAHGPADASRLFAAGFDATIGIKLALCAQACQEQTEDGAIVARSVLVTAVEEQIRESGEHLSSGGYKTQQELPDLFQLTCERELELLTRDEDEDQPGRLTRAQADQLVAGLTGGSGGDLAVVPADAEAPTPERDILEGTRAELLASAGVERPAEPAPRGDEADLAELGVAPVPWRVDPDDRTAGVLLGCAPWEALAEQARAFVFAVEWLTEASIVRVSAPLGNAMATLIHDGFGNALKTWAAKHQRPAWQAVRSLSAFRGERFDWDEPIDGGDGVNVYANLRWRHCEVTLSLRRVLFVNCDFRATRFVRCSFEAVTFVNCLMDGAYLEGCRIVGAAVPHDPRTPPYRPGTGAGREDRLPEFVLPVGAELAADFAHYRGTPGDARFLYSPTSGVACVPVVCRPEGAMEVPESTGGLTVFGGRLSSLMVRRCTLVPGADGAAGSITLAHIAGSSLDVVEQNQIRLVLSWCVILGLTVSDLVDAQQADGEVVIEPTECVLTNTWFGRNLHGTVAVTDCQAYALTNLSTDLAVAITDSAHGAVLNAATDNAPVFGTESLEQQRSTRSALDPIARRIAYRSQPAEVEMALRAAERRTVGADRVTVAT